MGRRKKTSLVGDFPLIPDLPAFGTRSARQREKDKRTEFAMEWDKSVYPRPPMWYGPEPLNMVEKAPNRGGPGGGSAQHHVGAMQKGGMYPEGRWRGALLPFERPQVAKKKGGIMAPQQTGTAHIKRRYPKRVYSPGVLHLADSAGIEFKGPTIVGANGENWLLPPIRERTKYTIDESVKLDRRITKKDEVNYLHDVGDDFSTQARSQASRANEPIEPSGNAQKWWSKTKKKPVEKEEKKPSRVLVGTHWCDTTKMDWLRMHPGEDITSPIKKPKRGLNTDKT